MEGTNKITRIERNKEGAIRLDVVQYLLDAETDYRPDEDCDDSLRNLINELFAS